MGTSHNELEARAATFVTLVIGDLGLIISNRAWSISFLKALRQRNAAFWGVSGGTILFLILSVTVPSLRDLFRFGALTSYEAALALGAGFLSILLLMILKGWLVRRLIINSSSRRVRQ